MVTLTPLALQNAPLLRVLRDSPALARMQDLPKILDRDKSNVRKSVISLEADGLLTTPQALGGIIELTPAGREVLEALDRAEGGAAAQQPAGAGVEVMIAHQLIVPDGLNPRKSFDEEALDELAASILADGQLQNLVVRPAEPMENYGQPMHRLVAGERRWRAIGRLIQQGKLPADTTARCLVISIDDKAHARLALIENLQRRDLSPLDEARGFQRLIDDYGYTTDSIAEDVKFTQRFVQQRLQLMQLTEADQILLEKGQISIEEARRRVAERNRMTLSLPPAQMMLLAEITAHVERNGKAVSYWGKAVEIADGGTSPELEALEAARLVNVHRRDREDARSYITLVWQTKDKVEVTLPDFKGGTRPACVRRLRTEVLGADVAAQLDKAKTWSAAFLNGPFEIPDDAKAEILARETKRAEQVAAQEKRDAYAREVAQARLKRLETLRDWAKDWVVNPIVGDVADLAEIFNHPLPWHYRAGKTTDAQGATVTVFGYGYGNPSVEEETLRSLLVIGINAVAGYATPAEAAERPSAPEPGGPTGDTDADLEAHEEGVCDPETCPHCDGEEVSELGLDEVQEVQAAE